VALDKERLDTDLEDFQQLRQMIQVAKSDPRAKGNGVNMRRLVGILSGVDDAALEAATWKSLAELKVCMQVVKHDNPGRWDQFGTRVAMDLQLLREVGGQLFHPTFRAAVAADEIILAVADASSSSKGKPQ